MSSPMEEVYFQAENGRLCDGLISRRRDLYHVGYLPSALLVSSSQLFSTKKSER